MPGLQIWPIALPCLPENLGLVKNYVGLEVKNLDLFPALAVFELGSLIWFPPKLCGKKEHQ
jgi:hypothetical protein